MNKEFCTYEQALALKELGFDEPCFGYFIGLGDNKETPYKFMFIQTSKEQFIGADNAFHRPLYQQAFKWFREKHKLESIVVPSGNSEGKTNGYYFEIIFDFSKDNIESDSYPSYEEAEQACLNKLIETIKNK
jgi:hypothetical protein